LIPNYPLSVSLKEAAKLLSVSPNTVRRHAKSGILRTVQLGRRRVVPFDALKDLIRAREEGKS
jgi:excisionase family DNA binding protein